MVVRYFIKKSIRRSSDYADKNKISTLETTGDIDKKPI